MLKKLRLERFKNFEAAELDLGPLTILVGENASGKSNIREAFRFLHGISRGYALAEIMGQKWVEGGVLQWRGIRGGSREIAFLGQETFALEVTFAFDQDESEREVVPPSMMIYRVEAHPGANGQLARVVNESLRTDTLGYPTFTFDSQETDAINHYRLSGNLVKSMPSARFMLPMLSQDMDISSNYSENELRNVRHLNPFRDMRFLDLSPDAMRLPSLPGQPLGDRGENLASVLQQICATSYGKETLIEWIQELTPMDARDFEFVSDLTGKITLVLVEGNGQRTSAYSASDGTLRFLAMIAALLGPKPARFYFFEELDNGLHPSRLHLLLQLIEQKVADSHIQIVATTHSSQLLNVVSHETLEAASLIYRLEERRDAQIKRILEIPDAPRVLSKYDPARLHAMGWFEDTVAFTADEEETE